MASGNYKNYLNQLENTLDQYFGKKAPALPLNIKDLIVKLAPYITILAVISTAMSILGIFGIGSSINSIYQGTFGSIFYISTLILIPVVILEAMAIQGLFSRKEKAWRYIYWAQLISLVAAIVRYNVIGGLIGAAIGFYFLFQIKNLYK